MIVDSELKTIARRALVCLDLTDLDHLNELARLGA